MFEILDLILNLVWLILNLVYDVCFFAGRKAFRAAISIGSAAPAEDPAAQIAAFFRSTQQTDELREWAAEIINGTMTGWRSREARILRKLAAASGTMPGPISIAGTAQNGGCYLTVVLRNWSKCWYQLDLGGEQQLNSLHGARSASYGGNPQRIAPGVWLHTIRAMS